MRSSLSMELARLGRVSCVVSFVEHVVSVSGMGGFHLL